MKRASITKFNNGKMIIHPINTLTGGGGIASSPYFIEENPTYIIIAERLLDSLDKSIEDAPRPLNWEIFQKNHLKKMEVKSIKELHDGTLNVNIFTKDENYHISPTINKGIKQGFSGNIHERIIIPISSSIEELAEAIEEAFEKCG